MRLKIDVVTRVTSATQDGVREKLGVRAQLLDELDEAEARSLCGQVVEASFMLEQETLPGFEDAHSNNGHVDEGEQEVLVPARGRRRRGTRSTEQATADA